MGIKQATYGGVPLSINTPESDAWNKSYLNPEDSRITTEQRTEPPPGLIGITWPLHDRSRPNMRPGLTWYPCMASRWAESHWEINQAQYDKIVPQAFTGDGPQELPFLLQQDGNIITTPMYALPPRPIGKIDGKPGLFHLVLVDERYFWQRQSAGNLVFDDGDSWTDVLSIITTALGISLSVSPEAVYLLPQPLSDLYSKYESAPILLDAVLANLGRVLVRNLDGTFSALRNTQSDEQTDANYPNLLLGGGNWTSVMLTNKGENLTPGAVLPESVVVTFPKRLILTQEFDNAQVLHLPFPQTAGDVYAVTITLESAGYGQYGGSPNEYTLHDTCEAWYDSFSDTAPQNLAQITALAAQMAQDYYNSQIDGIDLTIPGLGWSTVEGQHDVIWEWSRDKCQTRVMQRPYNWGYEDFLHHAESPGSGSSGSSSSPSSGSSRSSTSSGSSGTSSGSSSSPSSSSLSSSSHSEGSSFSPSSISPSSSSSSSGSPGPCNIPPNSYVAGNCCVNGQLLVIYGSTNPNDASFSWMGY